MAKSAGTMAAIWVILSVMGLIVLVGVVLLMMWFGNGIQHSPSETGRLLNGGSPRGTYAVASTVQNLSDRDVS